MPRYSPQDVEEIAETLRNAKNNGKPAHILFGAGCSRSAGIPLASEFVAEIHKFYPMACRRLPEADQNKYGACMQLLSPKQRSYLLTPYLQKASINWAHVALAQFMCEKFVERALTVNFDNLLARSCGLLSLYPAIYDFASAPTSDVSLIVSPAIIHLHGQGHGIVRLNTEEETKTHATKIAPVLRQSMDQPLLVVGYSGGTDDVLRILREHYPGTDHLYWLSYNDDPDPAVRIVAENFSFFKCIGGIDADRFLIELAQKLSCWPPRICTNPIGHLLAELNPVADYPTVPGNEVNILSTTRSRLAELEKGEQEIEQSARKMEKLLFEARYDEVVKVFDAVPVGRITKDQQHLVVAALMLGAKIIFDEMCKTKDSANFAQLFKQVEVKCKAALRIDPESHDALNNWGNALINRAQRESDPAAADECLRQAEAKYEAALAIKPDKHETLYNWGNALSERAERASDPAAAEELFKQAEVKYDAALTIKPDKHEALYNWGIALAERARRASDPAVAEELFKQAEAKYEAALTIKPDKDEALTNWGHALTERARRASDPAIVEELFKQAQAKCEAVLAIKPDDYETLINWGGVLAGRARRSSDPAATEELFKQAEAKYDAALAIKPDRSEALYNWGNALSERAERASEPAAADEFFKLAEAKYEAALTIKPDEHEVLNNWGGALAARAKRESDPAAAKDLFKLAEAKYEAALHIRPNDFSALHAYGSAILERAKRTHEKISATELLTDAESKLNLAKQHGDPDTYNLACVYALLGRIDDCRTVLEAAEKAGELPTSRHMEGDDDLGSVRQAAWFGELIQRRKNSS